MHVSSALEKEPFSWHFTYTYVGVTLQKSLSLPSVLIDELLNVIWKCLMMRWEKPLINDVENKRCPQTKQATVSCALCNQTLFQVTLSVGLQRFPSI
jgi:hypothetical protein